MEKVLHLAQAAIKKEQSIFETRRKKKKKNASYSKNYTKDIFKSMLNVNHNLKCYKHFTSLVCTVLLLGTKILENWAYQLI